MIIWVSSKKIALRIEFCRYYTKWNVRLGYIAVFLIGL